MTQANMADSRLDRCYPGDREDGYGVTKQRPYPGQVTRINCHSFQVRIVRDGVEHSSCFSWTKHGGQGAAMRAAVDWRDSQLKELPAAGNALGSYRVHPLPHKRSGERVGVTRYVRRDRRKQGCPEYLTFGANWVDSMGTHRIKSFQVGRVGGYSGADERHARATANAFRDEYEHCLSAGVRFDPTRYAEWKSRMLYPFSARCVG